jgi:hypothetical protein
MSENGSAGSEPKKKQRRVLTVLFNTHITRTTKRGDTQMFPTLKAYDENGELVMRQGPFMAVMEALAIFEQEKREAVHNKVFMLIMEPEGQKITARVGGVNFWSYAR